MKTLKRFDFPEAASAIKAIYDWDAILSGKIVQLEEGVDFKCKVQTICMMARNQAKKRGVTVKVAKVEGGVVIQAGPPGSAPKADEQETEE